MQSSDLGQIYKQVLNASSSGLVMFENSGHNIVMATHASMYRYLPITKELAINTTMYGANVIFICRSQQVGYTGSVLFKLSMIITMYNIVMKLDRNELL